VVNAAGPGSIDGPSLRRLIIDQSKRAGVGHIGSALSIADILAALYGGVLRGVGTADADRDRFILSKGHAALALYAALHCVGVIDARTLDTYCGDGSLLGVHPEHQLDGVEISTGSLGQGLAVGVGIALAARIQRSPGRVFVLLSDAELNEGSVWESVMFAGHHGLENLVAIVDVNGQQALAKTRDVIDLGSVADKWAAFSWGCVEVDGHDAARLSSVLGGVPLLPGRPTLVAARTTAGKGVSFMEGRVEWHYLPLSEAQYSQALVDIDPTAE
jgi:transketolase